MSVTSTSVFLKSTVHLAPFVVVVSARAGALWQNAPIMISPLAQLACAPLPVTTRSDNPVRTLGGGGPETGGAVALCGP